MYVWSRLHSGSRLLIEKVPLQLGLQLSLPKGWHHQNCRHDTTVVLLYCSVVLCIQSGTYSGRLKRWSRFGDSRYNVMYRWWKDPLNSVTKYLLHKRAQLFAKEGVVLFPDPSNEEKQKGFVEIKISSSWIKKHLVYAVCHIRKNHPDKLLYTPPPLKYSPRNTSPSDFDRCEVSNHWPIDIKTGILWTYKRMACQKVCKQSKGASPNYFWHRQRHCDIKNSHSHLAIHFH